MVVLQYLCVGFSIIGAVKNRLTPLDHLGILISKVREALDKRDYMFTEVPTEESDVEECKHCCEKVVGIETEMDDIVEGQYVAWIQGRCPVCYGVMWETNHWPDYSHAK